MACRSLIGFSFVGAPVPASSTLSPAEPRRPDAGTGCPPAVFLWRVGAGDGRPALDSGELQLRWRCRVVPSPIGARTGTSGARQPSPAWRRSLRAAGTRPRPDRAPAGRAQRLRPDGCIDIRLHPVTTAAIRLTQVPAFRSGRSKPGKSSSMHADLYILRSPIAALPPSARSV